MNSYVFILTLRFVMYLFDTDGNDHIVDIT